MYWPLGAPRVYAAPRRRSRPPSEEDSTSQSEKTEQDDGSLLGLKVSRNGRLFATITANALHVWQTSPAVLITSAERSEQSLKSYGKNVALLLRPDASIAAVQTSLGYIVTYNITLDADTRVYQQIRTDERAQRHSAAGRLVVEEARLGQREVHIRFRMVIKIDAGIGKALALEDELVVATEKPAAVQCIRWAPTSPEDQTITEIINRVPWLNKKNTVIDLVYDRAMSLFLWITNDGKAYAVQRITSDAQRTEGQGKYFRGHEFHAPQGQGTVAVKAAINARFSLLAIGCANGEIYVYVARDYVGSLPLSHKLKAPAPYAITGNITFLSFSPDGYCLIAGYEHGWVMWSVYGKLGGSSFTSDRSVSEECDERWLLGVIDGTWISNGAEVLLIAKNDDRLWALEVARSAVTSCFNPANVSRMLIHTNSMVMVYRGYDSSNIMSLSSDASLWSQIQIPATFLSSQSPLRCAVISPDGRYVAVAGRRGLAHYSFQSGRWKVFDNPHTENSFLVRGGMCWYQHILIVAVETDTEDELRLYSRETGLNEGSELFSTQLPSPAVSMTLSGNDSLLVYTYENNLYHYIISTSDGIIQLYQVGQIGLHGIVRAPARVRAITWYIPEHQLVNGDPAQDVIQASVVFLVDAKLVLLQPTKDESGSLKYDMRIIANEVEYFSFTRDQVPVHETGGLTPPASVLDEDGKGWNKPAPGLLDSLWYFDGHRVQCWPDVQDLLKAAADNTKSLPAPVPVPVDFYPTSIALTKGVIFGLESELFQRRELQFASYRFSIRTQLFLPAILRFYLSTSDATAALSLCHHYQNLSYFAHVLEVLLHGVLEEEVDKKTPEEQALVPQSSSVGALLPTVLSFLSSFPDYLNILIQCTRKTEIGSWKTLFATLPPPQELFEKALEDGLLKAAGGFLLVLHTFEELPKDSELCVRLLIRAKEVGDWDLCKELARFLMAVDDTGDTLREAMRRLDLETPRTVASKRANGESPNVSPGITQLSIPRIRGHGLQPSTDLSNGVSSSPIESATESPSGSSVSAYHSDEGADYFSQQP